MTFNDPGLDAIVSRHLDLETKADLDRAAELLRWRQSPEGKRAAAKRIAFILRDNAAHAVASSPVAWRERSVWMRLRFAWLRVLHWTRAA